MNKKKNGSMIFQLYRKSASRKKMRLSFNGQFYDRIRTVSRFLSNFTKKEKSLLPGSDGEHKIQEEYGTVQQALLFYNSRVFDHLNQVMKQFISEQDMVFISTADGNGECDCSFRAGGPGFVTVLGETQIAYPEFRGNGVFASIGNISENPHIGMLFVDFRRYGVGLHINGKASVLDNRAMMVMSGNHPEIALANTVSGAQKPERWIVIDVEEAYIHCSKNIPRMQVVDDKKLKKAKGDFFTIKREEVKQAVKSLG